MYFRLRKDTRDWFRHLQPNFAVDFDMFYLSLLSGLASGRKEDVVNTETTELVDYFPGDYRPKGRLIVSLFLSRELRALGIEMTEKQSLHSAIREYVDPLSPSHLSDHGVKEMNRYSFGGYDVLSERMNKPSSLETFLLAYKTVIASLIATR